MNQARRILLVLFAASLFGAAVDASAQAYPTNRFASSSASRRAGSRTSPPASSRRSSPSASARPS